MASGSGVVIVLNAVFIVICSVEETYGSVYCPRTWLQCNGVLAPAVQSVSAANLTECKKLCDRNSACTSIESHGQLCWLMEELCTNQQLYTTDGVMEYYKSNEACGTTILADVTSAIRSFWKWSTLVIGSIGIVSNMAILVVMNKVDRLSSSTVLFQSIAVFDTLVIISSFDYVTSSRQINPVADVSMYYGLSPLVSFCKKVSIHLLVLMTLERFMVVCWALDGCWFNVKRTFCSILLVVCVNLGLVLLTEMPYIHTNHGLDPSIPSVVEFRQRNIYRYEDVVRNQSVSRIGMFDIYTGTYFHSGTLNFIYEFLLPWAVLLFVNAKIIFTIRQAQKKRKQMTQDSDSSSTNDVTKALIVVVIVFMSCELPRKFGFFIIPNENFIPRDRLQAFIVIEYVGRVLSVVNASVNLYIYILTGRKFRTIFMGMLGCKEQKQASNGSTMTMSTVTSQ